MLKSEVAAGPPYHIWVYRTGRCRIAGQYAYYTLARERDHLFCLYVSVVQGNGLTALVDTGMESVDEMNRMAGFLMTEPIVQDAGEDTPSILRRAGVSVQDVDWVLLTHNHYDHCSNLPMFPHARVAIPERAWRAWHEEPEGAVYLHPGHLAYLESLHAQGRVLLLDEGTVAPGIGVRWVGGHTICSQFVYVNTGHGVALFTGDTVQMYGNVAHDDIIAIHDNAAECRRALDIARQEADILLPGHDPLVLDQHPDGVVA